MKFRYGSNDTIVALTTSFMLSLIVFLPILLGHNFPLWSSDNLFGSYPPLEVSRQQFLAGDADWFPLAGRGINFAASVNNFAYSPVFRMIFFSSAGATFIASAIVQFLCFFGGGIAFYFVVKNFVKDEKSALYASIAYQLSFATLYYLQTFPNIVLQLFFLLSVLIVQNSAKINAVLMTSLLAATASTILLTGHVVYGVYFLLAHLLVTGYCLTQLPSKKARLKLVITYAAGVILAALIAQYRLIPFLLEVLNGSRVSGNFVPGVITRPVAFIQLFIPEIAGVSINKSTELTGLLSFKDVHSTFLYSGIAGILLAMGAVQIKAARFWFIISLYFVLDLALPGLIGVFSNAVFYPFQHGSHLYLASFFWTITAAITLSHLSDIQARENFEKFLSQFKVIFVVSLLGVIFSAYASLLYLNVSIWITKALGVLVSGGLILYIYKSYRTQDSSSVSPSSFFMKRLTAMTIAVLVLASFAFVYATPVGRNAVLFLAVSIAILGLGFPMLERKMTAYAGQLTPAIWIFTLIALAYAASELVIPLVPQLGSIDYPVEGYFRLTNEYSRLSIWRTEWFVLVVLALYKLYLIVFWLLKKLRASATQAEGQSVVAFLILLALADQLPAFLEFSHYISKPFVRVDYSKLFERSGSDPDTEHLGYRLTNVHKALPVSPLFDYRSEAEVLSNLPYAYGYRSYGGVNSQISKRERTFYDAYVENRTLKDKLLPNQPMDEIAVGTNFTDERILALLGVKYNIEGRSDAPVPPALVDVMGEYNIVYYGSSYYGIPHAAGSLDLSKTDPAKIPGVLMASSLIGVKGKIERQPAQMPVLVGAMGGYNIIHYGLNYYGVPQTTGSLDLSKTDPVKIPGTLVASSLIGVKDHIERQPVQTPALVGQVGAYNIVHYGSNYYGIPQATGQLDLSKTDPAKIPGVLIASSLSEIYCLFEKKGEQAVCAPLLEKTQSPKEINYKEYPFALSRIMLFSGYKVAADVAEAARMVRDGLVDLEKEIIVENKIPFAPSPKEAKKLTYKEFGYDHIRVVIENGNSDRILLFNDSYNSGWKASADGRALEVIPANGISMAVVLPEDVKAVDLTFQPKGASYFKRLHQLGLILLVIAFMVGLYKQKIMAKVNPRALGAG